MIEPDHYRHDDGDGWDHRADDTPTTSREHEADIRRRAAYARGELEPAPDLREPMEEDAAEPGGGQAHADTRDEYPEPYPLDRLKGVLGDAAKDVVHLAQCDPSMAAGYALFVAAFACQGRWRVGSSS